MATAEKRRANGPENKKARSTVARKVKWFGGGFVALMAASAVVVTNLQTMGSQVAAIATNVESLGSQITSFMRTRAYLQTRRHPYPSLLDEKAIASWDLGTLELATYQIDGYLGRLTASPGWIKLCLTTAEIFPNDYASQYNDRVELPESPIDRQNKALLLRQIDKIEINNDPLLRINDLRSRLLHRAASALLHRYKDTELAKLQTPELYLLRNAIYAQHGRPFDTAKLEKFANRNGWPSRPDYKPTDVSPVELCNAFYLNQLHAARELGALGRGVLVRQPPSPAVPELLRASLCSCLAEPKTLVECRENSEGDLRDEFKDYVDLVIDLAPADENTVEWTFLDPHEVASADLDTFQPRQDRFLSAALDFNAAVQASLHSHGAPFQTPAKSRLGAFWGPRVTFTQQTLASLASDPSFLRDLSGSMCRSLVEALDRAGPFIPRLAIRTPVSIAGQDGDLKIFQKPIVFDGLRIKLTQEYIRKHYGDPASDIEFVPRMIAIHRSGIGTLSDSYEALKPPVLPRADTSSSANEEVNASVHYLVDRDGSIYKLMLDFFIAKHVRGLDRFAIGISNVGTSELPLTDAQLSANEQLIRSMIGKYGNVKWLINASEADVFKGHAMWEEKDVHYRTTAVDPGKEFMKSLRARLKDLSLASAP